MQKTIELPIDWIIVQNATPTVITRYRKPHYPLAYPEFSLTKLQLLNILPIRVWDSDTVSSLG